MVPRWVIAAVCLMLVSPAATGSSGDAATRPAAAPGAIVLSADVFPEGVGDEQEYRRFLAETTERLRQNAAAAEGPASVIEANLTVANWVLARELEPAASRLLHGIEQAHDREALAEVSAEAAERLKAASAALEHYQPTEPAESGAIVRQWEDVLAMLEAFSESFAALGLPDDDAATSARQRAAAGLAAYLDDPRREIAIPAKLWQATLLLRAGEPDRSVRLLEPTLSPIAEPVPGFFTRLLRARAALAAAPETDIGRYAAAMTVILRLEERCESVFPSSEQAAAAETACSWTRWCIGRQWRDVLEAAGDDEAAGLVRELIDRIYRERLSDEPLVVLRIGRTIPMLVGKDRIAAPATASAPAPVSGEPAELPDGHEPESPVEPFDDE